MKNIKCSEKIVTAFLALLFGEGFGIEEQRNLMIIKQQEIYRDVSYRRHDVLSL